MDDRKVEALACSIARMSCRMKFYGNADIVSISLLKVLYKYQDYVWEDDLSDAYDVPNHWQEQKKGILLELERKLIEKCRDICRTPDQPVTKVISSFS